MCGIAGIISASAPADPEQLGRMADALAHRGPDDRGIWTQGRLGLAQTRLSIIDLAGGHQPIVAPASGAALVANGEIYNYVELRAELKAAGCRFATGSDSEAALHAVLNWGERGVQRLHGMFACALADPADGSLRLWRDRLGIKPLYIHATPERVLFASEIKALLAALNSVPPLNPDALAQFLQNQFSTGRETIFQGIERLLPGEQLHIDAALGQRRSRYWKAPAEAPQAVDFETAAEHFDALFDQVMEEHVRADVPVGLFLSGGVDSALLLAALARRQDQPVRTFSVGYRDVKMPDELDAATRIAAHFGARHQRLELDSEAVLQRMPQMIWAADDLMRDYACLPTLALAEAAAGELKVVFSGEGGDEAFAGYRRYHPAVLETAFKRLRSPQTGGYRARPELKPGAVRGLFVPALAERMAAFRAPTAAIWQRLDPSLSAMQKRQLVDIETALPDNLLVKNDRMLMAHGLEGRVPFLDHRVVEFGLRLPDALKAGRRGGKLFLKQWGERLVPAAHLWQKKRGFYVPVSEWLHGPLLDGIRARLPHTAAMQAWCEPAALDALLQRQATRGDVVREVFCLVQFAIWHRLFVEGRGERPPSQSDLLAWLQ